MWSIANCGLTRPLSNSDLASGRVLPCSITTLLSSIGRTIREVDCGMPLGLWPKIEPLPRTPDARRTHTDVLPMNVIANHLMACARAGAELCISRHQASALAQQRHVANHLSVPWGRENGKESEVGQTRLR